MNTFTTGQLRLVFDTVVNQLLEQENNFIENQVESWLLSKRQNYSGNNYIDQIERNAIYLTERSAFHRHQIAAYLHEGKPTLQNEEDIAKFVEESGILESQEVSPKIVAFLRGHAVDYGVSLSGWDWYKLRNFRKASTKKEYVEEIELICRVSQANSILAKIFLSYFLRDRQMAGVARNIADYELYDTVNQRIYFWANFCIGNVKIESDKLNKKGWQFWKK